jgi:hypothetical protein
MSVVTSIPETAPGATSYRSGVAESILPAIRSTGVPATPRPETAFAARRWFMMSVDALDK